MSKRTQYGRNDEEAELAIKRHKREIDELMQGKTHREESNNNIDEALLNEDQQQHRGHHGAEGGVGGAGGVHNVDEAAAAAAAVAAYDELIQQPERAAKHARHDDDEVGLEDGLDEEEEEDEEDMDDDVHDKDHVPEDDEDDEDHEMGRRSGTGRSHSHGGLADPDADADSDTGGAAAGKRGRKPMSATGSAEWKQQRKDSHKEVERRRRENINHAINKLSELLPVKENSKAAILLRAAEYITKMKETENANIEKWTLQKLLSEQNAAQLSNANDKLTTELGNAYKEIDILKKKLHDLGN